MRIPSDMPLRGWTADASYANVPRDMSLSIENVIPNDQYQGRIRLSTRPSVQIVDWLGEYDTGGSIFDGDDFPIQCVVPCANFADDGSGNQVRVDRLVIVAGGRIFQMLPDGLVTPISGHPTGTAVLFNTTGPVSGVQFKDHVYFCDGGAEGADVTAANHHYYKLSLVDKVPLDDPHPGDITIDEWSEDLGNPATVTDTSGPNSASLLIGGKYYTGSLLVKMGARLAMAGVKGAEEIWFLSAIDDPDDWNPQSGTTTDALAGGTNAAEGYGTIGEPIEALAPFGQSGLLICGKTSLTYLAGDPAVVGPTMHSMSRTLGIAGRDAWCAGPNQSVFVLTREGLLNLQPNMFAVDKSSMISGGRLDSFFTSRRWDKITPVLIHDVARQGVWIWLNDSEQPQESEHLFYSYATNGFFPIKMAHGSFPGATCGTPAVLQSGGTPMLVMGSQYGVLGCFDPNVICGSDGQAASWVTGNEWTNGDSTRQVTRGGLTHVAAATEHRIESEVSIGPLFVPEPNEMLIREVTLEASLDEYLPDTTLKGETNHPRVELVYGDSVQGASSNDVSNITVTMESELIVDGGYWDADSGSTDGGEDGMKILDGGAMYGIFHGAADHTDLNWREPVGTGGAGDGSPIASTDAAYRADDKQGLDGGGSSRPWASTTWQASTLFVGPENRKYYPTTDNGYYLERIAYPEASSSKKWVARYNDGNESTAATYHETTTVGTSRVPVTYIQRASPFGSGIYPVDLRNQRFHGVRRPLKDDAALDGSSAVGDEDFVYGFQQAPNFADGGIDGSEFGSFDANTIEQDETYLYQWDTLIDGSAVGGYPDHRQDIFHVSTGETDEISILDLGCLDRGRGNRRRCRVRALVAFVRVRGSNGSNGNPLAEETSGHPFVLERMTVEVDAVGPRNTVEVEECFGSGTDQDGGGVIDPTTGEPGLGACCHGTNNDTCTDALSYDGCKDLEGHWQGDGSVCASSSCNIGACCYSGGPLGRQCAMLNYDDCASKPGSLFYGYEVPCESVQCATSMCCFPLIHPEYGACADLSYADCVNEGGKFWPGHRCQEGTHCDDLPPPPPGGTGACCDAKGEGCQLLTENACIASGGEYWGDNSTCEDKNVDCSEDAPTGACCLYGSCLAVGWTQETCVNNGGTYQGDGSTCADVTCPAPTGACCTGGSCTVVTEKACAEGGGEYKGNDIACGDINCAASPTGACCIKGSCSILSEAECLAAKGEYQSDGSTCTPDDPCTDPTGACCVGDTCYTYTKEQCGSLGGRYIEDDPSDNPCAKVDCSGKPVFGACCYPSAYCNQETLGDCVFHTGPGNWHQETECADVNGGDGCPELHYGRCCYGVGNAQCIMTTAKLCADAYYGSWTDGKTCKDECTTESNVSCCAIWDKGLGGEPQWTCLSGFATCVECHDYVNNNPQYEEPHCYPVPTDACDTDPCADVCWQCCQPGVDSCWEGFGFGDTIYTPRCMQYQWEALNVDIRECCHECGD